MAHDSAYVGQMWHGGSTTLLRLISLSDRRSAAEKSLNYKRYAAKLLNLSDSYLLPWRYIQSKKCSAARRICLWL